MGLNIDFKNINSENEYTFISNKEITENDINGHYYNDTLFDNCSFVNIKINNCTFSNCYLLNCRFIKCQLYNCKFNDCHIESLFKDCEIIYTNFTHSEIDCKISSVIINNCYIAYNSIKQITGYNLNVKYCGIHFSSFGFIDIINTNLLNNSFSFSSFRTTIISDLNYNDNSFDYCSCKNDYLNPLYKEIHPSIIPETGNFIGYKKAYIPDFQIYEDAPIEIEYIADEDKTKPVIVKLEICEDALRRGTTASTKCRCSKAKVLDIYDINNKDIKYPYAFSGYDRKFIYLIDNIITIDDYEDNERTCAPGIHFFLSENEAKDYNN